MFQYRAVLLLTGALFFCYPAQAQTPLSVPAGMVRVQGGSYKPFYGNENNKAVTIPSFYMDAYAVTNAQFLEFVKANPKWAKSKVSKLFAEAGYLKHWEGDLYMGKDAPLIRNSPVVNISWFAANAYSKWKGKRLASIAEWEYAANAKLTSGKSIDQAILDWYSIPTPARLASVQTSPKNSFGIYGLHGLIWEWTGDFNSVIMESDSRSNSEISESLFCSAGSANVADKKNYTAFMRYAFRTSLKASYTVSNLGFRCAKNLK